MKKLYITSIILTASLSGLAQLPEDALKLSYSNTLGTARNAAIGGTMIGLGGEISAIHINPAGLGLYKNNEYVFSPGFSFNNLIKSDYRGNDNQKGKKLSNFNFGTSGVIIGGRVEGGNKKSAELGLSITKTADYNSSFIYQGNNNNSSGAERYAEEIVRGRYNIGNAFSERFLSLGARLANYTYLVDTFRMGAGGNIEVVAMPEFTNGVMQINNVKTTGASHEVSLAFATNNNDKLFIGGSLSMPFTVMQKNTVYEEKDLSTNTTNGFKSFKYEETVRTSGIGINAKLGLIYRPAPRVRFGATLHTPNVMALTDFQSGTMQVDLENVTGITRNLINVQTSSTKDVADGADEIENGYLLLTPWRLGVGGSLVLNETKNVKKQRAFIAADIEYVTYKTMRFSSTEDDVVADNYYKPTNSTIKNIYRNTFNFKLGGEIKFNTVMFRLGANYLGNPNKDKDVIKQSAINLSTGLGYRNKNQFIDVTYIHGLNKNTDLPYRLADKANTFASASGRVGTVMITYGKKF